MMIRALWLAMVFSGADGAGAAAGGGNAATAVVFAETLPEDIRGEAAFRDIKDLGSLAKGYLNAQKMLGHGPDRLLVMPAEGEADAWNAVYDKLGRPKTAGDYGFKAPDGVTVDAKLQEGFAAKAHEAGLSARQATELFAWWNQEVGGRAAAGAAEQAAASARAVETMKTEWGVAYDEKLATAKAALAHYGDKELVAYLEESKLGDDPRILRVFAKMGAQLREDGVIGRGHVGGDLHSPAEAMQQINALKADQQFLDAYLKKTNPGHANAVAKMQALYAQAFPDQAA